MTDYKTIRGKKIKSFATDLDNEQAEGQIFYSNTDDQFKTAVASSAWSSSGPLLTGRRGFWGTGTQTAGLAFGGKDGPGAGTAVTNATEEYNGSGWSTGGNLGTARYVLGGATNAPQTASLGFGGYGPLTNSTEEYDGSSWTSGGNLNTARGFLAGAGTQTAALGFGGYTSGDVNNSEEYNGTSWTEGNDLAQTIRQMAGNGLQTAALSVGGLTGGDTARDITEEYNGTSWSSGGTMASAHFSLRSVGTQDDALAFGGSPPPSKSTQTQAYDGSSWSSKPTMATARNGSSCSGTSTAAITAGGLTGAPSTITSTSEEFNVTVNTITAGAWATGGTYPTGTFSAKFIGSKDAALGFAGYNSITEAFEYDGSSWTATNDIPNGGFGLGFAGTQTAGLAFGGYSGSFGGGSFNPTTSNEYNGSSFSSGGTTPFQVRDGTGFGTQTASLGAGGYAKSPPQPSSGVGVKTANTISYDGSSFSNVNSMNTAIELLGGAGTQTAGVVFGGQTPPPNGNLTEEWDGTNWTSASNLNTGRRNLGGFGIQTAAYAVGGRASGAPNSTFVELYNGTSWITQPSLATGRSSIAVASNFAGPGSGGTQNNEEFTGETTALNLKTITDS
jgi:hypothetical protein